uniref:Uncharacterized protein n=1 Tax=Monopterus albus TaxID=43700 RepID=A0A3Q3II56_MONAL
MLLDVSADGSSSYLSLGEGCSVSSARCSKSRCVFPLCVRGVPVDPAAAGDALYIYLSVSVSLSLSLSLSLPPPLCRPGARHFVARLYEGHFGPFHQGAHPLPLPHAGKSSFSPLPLLCAHSRTAGSRTVNEIFTKSSMLTASLPQDNTVKITVPKLNPFSPGMLSFIGSPCARAPITVSVFYPLTQVGKRRGGVFLKTGMVAKKQKQDTEVSVLGDAWSKYMAEVKKYKAHQCGDDDKTRPLVK